MKVFRCGDVVPGCTTELTGPTEDDVLRAVSRHADRDHEVQVGDDMLAEVRAAVRDA